MTIVRSKNDIPETVSIVINATKKTLDDHYRSLSDEVYTITKKILHFIEESEHYKCLCKPSTRPGILHEISLYAKNGDFEKDTPEGLIVVVDPTDMPNTENLIVMTASSYCYTGQLQMRFFLSSIQMEYRDELESIHDKNLFLLNKILGLKEFCKRMDLNFDESFEYRWLRI